MNDEFESTLQRKLAALQKQRMPSRDLWPGIEMALLKKPQSRIFPLVAAASLVACVLCGWLLLAGHRVNHDQTQSIVARLDALHQQQMSALKAAYGGMHPLAGNLDQQLREMDRAATAIKKALKDDPGNVTLLNMLTDIYQKQMTLVERVYEPNLQNSDMT
ncbi:MAG TPA: hypothetical protein VG962_08955 [Steroidobacteraceae bacterium]|nr:hypothetical protein [Steroidobacteraceae bacterium]